MTKGLDEVIRLKRWHKNWLACQFLFGILPVFALANNFQPILTDGYGRDLLPTLLPESLASHYHLIVVSGILPLVGSEILRRQFYARHKQDLVL